MDCPPRLGKLFSYLRSQPPVSVFLCSLACLSLTLLGLALYTGTTDSVIQNLDILDWSRVLQHLSKQKFCLPKNGSIPKNISSDDLDSVERTIKLKGPMFAPSTTFASSFPFRGLSVVPLDHLGLGHHGHNISVGFLLKSRDSQEVCLLVRGKSDVIKDLQRKVTDSCYENEAHAREQSVLVHSAAHLSSSWCQGGELLSFAPHVREADMTALSGEDRSVMVSHLLGAALALSIILAAALLWGAVKGGFTVRSGSIHTKSSSDGRGDLQLLRTDNRDEEEVCSESEDDL